MADKSLHIKKSGPCACIHIHTTAIIGPGKQLSSIIVNLDSASGYGSKAIYLGLLHELGEALAGLHEVVVAARLCNAALRHEENLV